MYNKSFRTIKIGLALLAGSLLAQPAMAANYQIDSGGKHAFIQFKVSHLGYSFVLGEFPDFNGSFSFDADDLGATKVNIDIDTTTADTRHAKRNVHIRSADFLDVAKFPTAAFTSTGFNSSGGGEGVLIGDLTMHGVTKSVDVAVKTIGEGKDPWGGYRAGFEGSATITMADFGINYDLGPSSRTVDIYFTVEGIRQ